MAASATSVLLSSVAASTALRTLIDTVMIRWRFDRDYQELKQEFGLSHYEGRGWRGIHHHATLCIVAHGFLVRECLKRGGEKSSARSETSLLPQGYTSRGNRKTAASSPRLHPNASLLIGPRHRPAPRPLPLLRAANPEAHFVT